MGRARPALAAAVCVLAGGCNGEDVPKPDPLRPPDELSRQQGLELYEALDQLKAARRTVRSMRRSPMRAQALHAKVREVVSSGALESNELDDFGKAAVGELGAAVPSLVERDADGVPESVDREAVTAFLQHAESDPAEALVGPARDEVATIEKTVEESKAGSGTRFPAQGSETIDLSVSQYLQDTRSTLAPVWPGLARRVRSLRERLAGSSAS